MKPLLHFHFQREGVNPSHSMSKLIPRTGDYHYTPLNASRSPAVTLYMTFTMPVFCLIFQFSLSIFFFYIVCSCFIYPSLFYLDLACDSHLCYSSSPLSILPRLSQKSVHFIKIIFHSFSEMILNMLPFILLGLTKNSAWTVFRVYRYNKSHRMFAQRVRM